MTYTLKQTAEMAGVTEHTLRYYTDLGLVPCTRDRANRRVFDDDSLNWLSGVKHLRACGISIEDVKHYCDLCRAGEDTRAERYDFLLRQRELAYLKLREARECVDFLEHKVAHYEEILTGAITDDMNIATRGRG